MRMLHARIHLLDAQSVCYACVITFRKRHVHIYGYTYISYIYTFMCTHTYIYIYITFRSRHVHIHVYAYISCTHIRIYMYIYTHIHVYLNMYLHYIQKPPCAHLCVYIYIIYIYICKCTHIFIYSYIYIHIYVHTHTYVDTPAAALPFAVWRLHPQGLSRKCTYTPIYTCKHIFWKVCIYLCIYIYQIYICPHTCCSITACCLASSPSGAVSLDFAPFFLLYCPLIVAGLAFLCWASPWQAPSSAYGVVTISRLLKMTRLFSKRALWNRRYSAKETYIWQAPSSAYILHMSMTFHTSALPWFSLVTHFF